MALWYRRTRQEGTSKEPLKNRQIHTLCTAYAERGGMKGRSIHSLRHAIVMHLREAGQGIEYGAGHLGQSNIGH